MNLFVYVLSGIFMAVGGGIMINGVNEIRLAQASASWPTTNGTIIISEIQTSSDSDGKTYRPFVKFSYRVNGETLTGDNVFLGSGGISSSNYRYANKIISKYPEQKRVEVFYNPSQPKQAVIEAGLTKKTFIQFTFGSLFLICGFGFGLLFWLMD